MKKFFTLFALLSIGLSAWAQEYTLHCDLGIFKDDEFYETMKANGDGTYSLRKLFYLTNENSVDPWFDPDDPDYEPEGFDTEYVFWVDDICRASFWMGSTGDGRENGWYDITFTFDPSIPIEYYEGPLTITFNERTVESDDNGCIIHLSDEVCFGIEGTLEQELEGVSIIYTRSKCNQWGTLCLPFNFLPNQSNVTFYQIESVADGVMTFAPFDEYENGEIFQIGGGESVVFKLDEGVDELVVSNTGATPYIVAAPEPFCIDDDWTMHGTFESVNSGSNTYYYYIANRDGEEGVYYGTNITVPPYRAWFTGPTPSGAPLRIAVNDTEGLQFVEQEDGTVKVSYDLQGRKLDDARKGLMIENGKVIMVK